MGSSHPKIGNYFGGITCFDDYDILRYLRIRRECGITMERQLHDSLTENKRLLTTEKGKMYGIYILDGFTGEVTELHDESIFDNWYDHCINPKHFKELANRHNCTYTLETFYKVTEEYNTNYLNIDSLLEISVDGERFTLTIDKMDGFIELDNDYETVKIFTSIDELNNWLIERELRPFPNFELKYSKKDIWIELDNKLCVGKSYRAFCKFSTREHEFTVIGLHYLTYKPTVENFQHPNKLIITVDLEKHWNDFEFIDAMDTLYQIQGIRVNDVFDLVSLMVDGMSLNSRDFKMQLGEKTLERGNYREFATKAELIQSVKNEYELDITEPVDQLIQESEKL